MPAAKRGRPSKARSLSPRTIEEIKAKIHTDALIKRLEEHIRSRATSENGAIVGTMAPSAVTAALGLLRKVLPDISESKVEVTNKTVDQMTDTEIDVELSRARALLRFTGSETTPPEDPQQLN